MSARPFGTWFVETLLRPVLVATMMTCLAVPGVLILEWVMPGWNGTYFLFFAFCASLEGVLSERVLQRKRITSWGYLASRVTEALVLLVLLKLANYIPQGLGQLWAEVHAALSHPDLLISHVDMLTGALFVPLWVGSLYVGRLVRELDVEAGTATPPPDINSTEYYLWLTQPSPARDRQEGLESLGEAFLWGGILLLVGSALIYWQLTEVSVPAISTLLYFALGVALLSQARFSVTHIGWQRQNVPVQPDIGRRWLLWTVIFLGIVAVVALLLPTRSSMGPLRALLTVVNALAHVFTLIFAFLYYLFMLVMSFIFPSVQPPQPPEIGAPSSATPLAPAAPATSVPWLQGLVSALFWVVILAIVGYAALRFLRDRAGLFRSEGESETRWWVRFLNWLRTLWSRWHTWREGMQAAIARRLGEQQGEEGRVRQLLRYLSPRRLPPRERVRFFYLSTVRRAAQAGRARGPGETPYEYRSSLDEQFPDLEPDLTGLTEAFVGARYDRRPVEDGDAKAVEPLWKRITAMLRRKRIAAIHRDGEGMEDKPEH
jgi:hypothetical protein